jgi:hypothetical protein
VFLVDTDVISEARKGEKGNVGVREFLSNARRNNLALFLSAIAIGELRQGVENIRHPRSGEYCGPLIPRTHSTSRSQLQH